MSPRLIIVAIVGTVLALSIAGGWYLWNELEKSQARNAALQSSNDQLKLAIEGARNAAADRAKTDAINRGRTDGELLERVQ